MPGSQCCCVRAQLNSLVGAYRSAWDRVSAHYMLATLLLSSATVPAQRRAKSPRDGEFPSERILSSSSLVISDTNLTTLFLENQHVIQFLANLILESVGKLLSFPEIVGKAVIAP